MSNIVAFTKFAPMLQSLNVVGTIGEMYANSIAYKVETKRLENEIVKIKEDTKVRHYAIDKAFELKIEELNVRREALYNAFNGISKELKSISVDKKKMWKIIEKVNTQVLDRSLPFEERQYLKEYSMMLIKDIHTFHETANGRLKKMIDLVAPVEIPNLMLGR